MAKRIIAQGAAIDKQRAKITAVIKALQAEDRRLTKLGCHKAYIHFKTGTNKMFLLEPTDARGKRKHIYIGVDPKKQQKAREKVERECQRDQVREHISQLNNELARLDNELNHLVWMFESCAKASAHTLKLIKKEMNND